ncbi:MAG: DUF2955 domain-containing protein [gamma proteobacterium symbiont of Taylorina sp.]|nr:DUF2955 domain-containing protein [gamma proteobacterium symbiont of Taylorina sp.]
MSTNELAAHIQTTKNPLKKLTTGWLDILQDATAVRVMRLSIGSTIAMALAYAFNWPLAMLTPVFTVVFLSLPLPRPSFYQGFRNMLQTLLAVAIGVFITLYLMPIPFIFSLIFGLLLFHTYYLINRGGSFWFVLILLISILLMPMLGNVHDGLAIEVSAGFVWSAWVAVWLIFLAHLLVPDPDSQKIPKAPPMHKGYVPIAAELALKSTIVAFPIAIFFIAFQLTDYILIMINAAIFTLSPDLSKGKNAISNSIISTLIGGSVAYFFYWILVAVPEYYFFISCFFLVALIFSSLIFSTRPDAKYYSSALVAMIILFNGSMGEDKDFTSLFFARVVLMALAGVYVILALKVLDRYWPAAVKK